MKDTVLKIIGIFFAVLSVAVILGLIAVEIYIWVTYANVPVEELPAWVIFFMFGRR